MKEPLEETCRPLKGQLLEAEDGSDRRESCPSRGEQEKKVAAEGFGRIYEFRL